ncbi:MAG: linked oxidase domain protein [Microbacteriaceae bacterium]|nr:linked oxidase domain protein [Microbacteriaceae bacterium]
MEPVVQPPRTSGRGRLTIVSVTDFTALTSTLTSWSDSPARLASARSDRSGWVAEGTPAIIVEATSVSEVQATVAFAAKHRIAIVTRGGATALTGAASAGERAIVLDLSRLDRILEIRVDDQVAVVEPGVITADLDRAARESGLFFAPDPGSVAISTVGGNIGTNAGGLRGAKYGVTRDAVLELDVVLADGSLVTVGHSTAKGVSGYDLASLFVGSEGTLGVVVRAVVRLLPVPAGLATVSASFPSIEAAAEAATAIGRAGLRPTMLEIIDGPTLKAIDEAFGSSLRGHGEALLIAQTDGLGAALEATAVANAIAPLATNVEIATDPATGSDLVEARRRALPAIERLGRVLIEDIAVPRSRLAEIIRTVQGISGDFGVPIFVFAHAGDGNVHPIILLEGVEAGEPIPANARAAADAIFAAALELGGTLTGEHGIGALKRDWIGRELGEKVHDLQKGIKLLLDPHGILNPGKAL